MLMAEQVAAQADLEAVLTCDPQEVGEGACGHSFVADFGREALRRPLSEAQQARFEALGERMPPGVRAEVFLRVLLGIEELRRLDQEGVRLPTLGRGTPDSQRLAWQRTVAC